MQGFCQQRQAIVGAPVRNVVDFNPQVYLKTLCFEVDASVDSAEVRNAAHFLPQQLLNVL